MRLQKGSENVIAGFGDSIEQALADRGAFADGPSDLAFGRAGSAFDPDNLYVATFQGELLELVGARR